MALYHAPRIVNDDLRIYIDFANKRCYPRQGTTFNNLVENSIGYLKNNVNFSENFNGIVRTNGGGDSSASNVVGDRIDINTTSSNTDRFKKETSFTFSFWVRWISGNGKIFSTGSSGSSNTDGCIWQFWADRSQWFWWDASGGATNNLSVSYSSLTSNEWGMMSYVYSHDANGNNAITVYRNNNQIATNSRSNSTHAARDRTTQTNLQYTLGGGYNSSCRNNNSVNDFGNFMCYNRALSAEEIAQNFNAFRGRYGI